MRCPSCDHEPPAGSKFCNRCGVAMESRCGACGQVVPSQSRFCNHCGHDLIVEAPPPAPVAPTPPDPSPPPTRRDPRAYTPAHVANRILTSRAALEGERKHVTVLFADVAGYTSLSERTDPETMHALMDRCFQILSERVHGREGTINQFTGDGIMALFGAPIAIEEAPRQAVQAALDMHRDLASLRDEIRVAHDFDFQLRIGIHSGPVVVGRIGDDLRMDYTAVGDTTNIAARLEQASEPGAVTISDSTRRQVAGFFDIEDLGTLSVKGRVEPVKAYRVVAGRRVRGRIEAANFRLTPLVGRRRELDTLWAALTSAQEGRGQVAFLVGDAGIGKSRLLHELRRRLGDQPHTWFEGLCTPYGTSAAFSAIADGLRRQFAIDDRDDEATSLGKLEAEHAKLGADLDWTLPFVRRLLSLSAGEDVGAMDAISRRSETFRALQARFVRHAEMAPLVLVIEDLHWIDAASEELIGYLSDSIPAARVLLVLTHRSGYRHPFGDRSYHHRIALQALSEHEMGEMTHSLFDVSELPLELRRAIAARAEGNPFFIEEVTKSLVEEGILRVHEGRVLLSKQIEQLSVPDSIHDILMARIDRLDDVPKRAIQVASVIGRDFSLRLLERISGVGDNLEEIVEELRALELIYEKASHPELAFTFKHALTHDVAYESVLVHRRKSLHQIVGSAIEELYRDRLAEQYEALAQHFTQAEDWDRAFHYHALAAEKAAAAYANQLACGHSRAALEMAPRCASATPDRLQELAEILGLASWCLSDFRGSADAFTRAAGFAGDPAARATNLGRGAYGLVWAHEYAAARETVEEATRVALACGSQSAHAIALASAFQSEAVTHGAPETREMAEESTRLAEASGDAEAIVRTLVHEAQNAEWAGEYPRAIAWCERGLELATGPLKPLTGVLRWFLGLSLCGLGEYARALADLQDGVALCDRIGDRALKARLLNSLGWCFAEFDCHARASEYNRVSTVMASELAGLGYVKGTPELFANGAINLAGNRIAVGDVDGALEHLQPVRDELATDGDPWMRWRYTLHVQDALARGALQKGDPEQALALTETELDGARRHRATKLEARALELMGRALVTLDRREDAERVLTEALATAERILYPPVTWRALSLLAEIDRRTGRGGAEERASHARRLVESRAAQLDDPNLRQEFGALGERLVVDPLGAYR